MELTLKNIFSAIVNFNLLYLVLFFVIAFLICFIFIGIPSFFVDFFEDRKFINKIDKELDKPFSGKLKPEKMSKRIRNIIVSLICIAVLFIIVGLISK